MGPNPYEVSEPELLRGMTISSRVNFLPDCPLIPGSFLGLSHLPAGPCWLLPSPTAWPWLGPQSLPVPDFSTVPEAEFPQFESFQILTLVFDVVDGFSRAATSQQ
jgi:hypothetical protein